MKQEPGSKASLPYEGEPLEVQHRKGTQVVVKKRDGSTVTMATAHFKKIPHQTPEKAGRWKLGPDFGHKPSSEPKARELSRLQERPDKVRLPEVGLSDPLDRMEPPMESVEEAPQPPLPMVASGCSSRPRPERGWISQEQISGRCVTEQDPVNK